ncbi:FAD-dependent oxidoreductase [Legionella pneumophila]|nr:FAD-dependent oxidoreductase [Legionella pneumophila]MDW8906536.1 FAD-dependent oxidoreductase [Legionella pneumophila]MDW9177662.1 FAD-dependent oxidoreductase [Legionella pneumophila]HAU1477756.1 FAD-dependent oxidoreductase [Legionella pneumophila]
MSINKIEEDRDTSSDLEMKAKMYLVHRMDKAGSLTVKDVHILINKLSKDLQKNQLTLIDCQLIINLVESRFTLAKQATRYLQFFLNKLDGKSINPILIPLSNKPFWQTEPHPFDHYRSTDQLPEKADIVIIGAGLTGASTAYHLIDAVKKRNLTVVLLDKGNPATEASGRNGGNFELLPENSVGIYSGLVSERFRFLKRCYPHVHPSILQIESEYHASLVFQFALKNRNRFKEIVRKERIYCDLAAKGWLYIAHTEEEEQAICDEVTLAAQHGERIYIWSRKKIREQFGINSKLIGRFIPDDGTYNPFKYTCCLIKAAIKSGIKLYTFVKVQQIKSMDTEYHQLKTNMGLLKARQVIVATNAFTSELLPELSAIKPHQSQIAITDSTPDYCKGRLITSEDGPLYLNQPRVRSKNGLVPLLIGAGDDRPMKNPYYRKRSKKVHDLIVQQRDKYFPNLKGKPFSTEWVGALAFTPDQLPAIGYLSPGIIIVMCCNGYGGSYTTAAGLTAAEIALTGKNPPWLPAEVFSPKRLLSDKPLFWEDSDSLWRIGKTLCTTLNNLNQLLAESLSYQSMYQPYSTISSLPHGHQEKTCNLDPLRVMHQLAIFRTFAYQELEMLIRYTSPVCLSKGEILFKQGDAGHSCFILIQGKINLYYEHTEGFTSMVAELEAGSVFGQMALFLENKRMATCQATENCSMLEIMVEPCKSLFIQQQALGIKLLRLLNQGVIDALHKLNKRLKYT